MISCVFHLEGGVRSGRLEDKDCSVVAFLVSGVFDYVDGGVFRTRCNRAHNGRRAVRHAIDV